MVKLVAENSVPFEFKEFYEKNYGDRSGATFLDIGSGEQGYITKYIEHKKNKVVAVDIINSLPCTNLIMSIRADIFEMNFVPDSFDCIIDNCSLQLCPFEKVKELVQKSRIWLKPQGRFYMKTAAESPYYKRVNSRLTTESDIKELFKGFKGEYCDFIVELGTGEIAIHYIIDMMKG